VRFLEFYRRRAKLGQKELARLANLPQSSISDLELGRRPTASQVVALEKLFGVPAERLLAEMPEDVVPPPPSLKLAIVANRSRLDREREERLQDRRRRRQSASSWRDTRARR